MAFSHRLATEADRPALDALMRDAIERLQSDLLSPAEVAASHAVMGLDSQLIADRTYFVIEEHGRIAGCGGWSHRATLYGGDHSAGRDAAPLDPNTEAARVRAMYTHPDFVRRGVGRLVLALCEAAAADAGFRRIEMMATLAGERLYVACGYSMIERVQSSPVDGVSVPLVRMGKPLARAQA